jgi:hypothetical protein
MHKTKRNIRYDKWNSFFDNTKQSPELPKVKEFENLRRFTNYSKDQVQASNHENTKPRFTNSKNKNTPNFHYMEKSIHILV